MKFIPAFLAACLVTAAASGEILRGEEGGKEKQLDLVADEERKSLHITTIPYFPARLALT